MNELKFNVRAPEHTKDSERDRVAARVVAELIRRGWHITFAESCTGGLAAGRLVDVPDASRVLDRAFVTYANDAKHELLGVRTETLDAYGAVSEQTAREMAAGAARAAHAEIGVGITGIAGPGGGSDEKPVGTVWLGLATREGVQARLLQLHGNRERIRTLAALNAMHWVLETVEKEER